jgi:hypothetical protein
MKRLCVWLRTLESSKTNRRGTGCSPEEKRIRLISELKAAEESCSLEMIYEQFGKYEADELSGYRRLDLGELFSAILYFCKGGLKTKLNKLLLC